MQDDLTRLLSDMAELLTKQELGTADLYLLGGAPLVLFEGRAGATKDLDVVKDQIELSNREAAEALFRAFGEATERSPYLDPVVGGLPPLPLGWPGRATRRPFNSRALRIWSLAPSDMIASKLRRWLPRDRADVRFICDRHPEVRNRLAQLSETDFFEVDWWEEMEPRRDQVLKYLDGHTEEL